MSLFLVVSLDSVDEHEQAIREDARCTLLMHDTRSTSEGAMEFTTCHCPHPQCTHYGQRGFGTHLVHCGADRGIPRLLCTSVRARFRCARHSILRCAWRNRITPSRCGPWQKVILCEVLAGSSMSIRIPSVIGLDRAGRHCRVVTTYLFDTLHITECQVDELWSFVRERSASDRR